MQPHFNTRSSTFLLVFGQIDFSKLNGFKGHWRETKQRWDPGLGLLSVDAMNFFVSLLSTYHSIVLPTQFYYQNKRLLLVHPAISLPLLPSIESIFQDYYSLQFALMCLWVIYCDSWGEFFGTWPWHLLRPMSSVEWGEILPISPSIQPLICARGMDGQVEGTEG